MKTEGEILKKIAGKEAKRFLKGILNKVPSQTLSIRYMNSSGLMLISEAILRINLLSISSFGCTGTVVVRPSACFKNTCEPFAWRASNPSFVRALRTSLALAGSVAFCDRSNLDLLQFNKFWNIQILAFGLKV